MQMFLAIILIGLCGFARADVDFEAARSHSEAWSKGLNLEVENFVNAHGQDPDPATVFSALRGAIAPGAPPKPIATVRHLRGVVNVYAPFYEECIIMSLTDGASFSFEVAVAQEAAHKNCTVHVFGCGRLTEPSKAPNGTVYHEECVTEHHSISPEGVWHISYEDALWNARRNADKPPPLARIDAGGWEYSAMRAVAASTRMPRPYGVSVLARLSASDARVPWAGRKKSFAEIAMFVDMAWRVGGYHLVEASDAHGCADCVELSFVRK